MNKRKWAIAGSYFLLSFVLLSPFIWLIYIWYPDPLPKTMGIHKIIILAFLINFIIWPLLIAWLYKQDHRKYFWDVAIMAVIQYSFVFLTIYFLYQNRPVWIVATIDNFEIVRHKDIYRGEANKNALPAEHEPRVFAGYQLLSADFASEDSETGKKQRSLDLEGISLSRQSDAIKSWDKNHPKIAKYALPIEQLLRYNEKNKFEHIKTEHPKMKWYLPVKGFANDLALIMDENYNPLTLADLSPWEMD